ncbi:phage tail domain-containing protein [Staphylococcus saprophyticus]|uniref:phage tail domain-containing protein n=1 Tax=Staphylococcus saprophyticus TaxID=29385 RepID=UPI0030167CEA
MKDGRWLRIIDEKGSFDVNDFVEDFIFLDSKTEYPVSIEDGITIKGVDGELPSVATFSPFPLVVRFGLDGYDEVDINLMEQRIRSLFYRRKPYYIVTSDNPGMKFLVNNPDMNPDYADFSVARFEMNFKVKKGFSESLKDTLDVNFLSENWQFGSGLITDQDISYRHNKKGFKIWNGSNDAIDPLNHKLIIRIKADAPNGLSLVNHTTGDRFIYYGALKSSQTLTLNRTHPIIGDKRVGFDSNWDWINLAEGMNDIAIEGNNITNVYTEFEFNFVYR